MAANIYDLSPQSIDISTYFSASLENGLPAILQISQNAAGQQEMSSEGLVNGYLETGQWNKNIY